MKNAFTITRELGTRTVTIRADYMERMDAWVCVSYIDGAAHDTENTDNVWATAESMISDAAVEMASEKTLDVMAGDA